MSFVHLSVHSEYSLHDSLIRVKLLFTQVSEQGMPAVAITDSSNMFGTIKAYKQGLEKGVKPIIASELIISTPRIGQTILNVLCRNDNGYRSLCEIMSRGYLEAPRDGLNRPIIPLEWFNNQTEGLIALSGGREGEIGRLLLNNRQDAASEALADMKSLFRGEFYLELQRIGHAADDRHNRAAVTLAASSQTPVVATNPARFLTPDRFASHEIRIAISQGRSVRQLREDHDSPCTKHQYLKSPAEMIELFSDIPSAIENTLRIAAKCSVDLTLGKNFLPKFPSTQGNTEAEFLRDMAREGLEERLEFYFKTPEEIADHRKEYSDRLEFELETINSMGFPGYFLIVADFIRWSKANDIPVGPGRGSGAGSLVAYSLGITDINPIPYNLLFERFLNPERVSMPDFDVDFCMDKREKVIQYVADTYGHNAVSQIITYGTMAAKMVIRDVARALGHPYRLGDSLSKMIPKRPDITISKAMIEVPALKTMYDSDSEVRAVLDHALTLEGLTRQVGKHAGGVLISPSVLTDFTPVYCEPDGSSLVSQYDKDDVETAGLVKFDFLGLKTLTVIDHALKPINERRKNNGEPAIEILGIPLDDEKAFALLQNCETTAVFQLESSGMKNLIKNLKPDCFEDIIALVALFRPGPLQSGMVDDFINRKHGRSEVSYPHPLLEPVLESTYGVIVYQEQVMQIAQVLAGYTLGGADMLRRAMGKKKPAEMAKQRSIFIEGAGNNNIDEELAGKIFDLMEKFAEYGFNKSHSAAYALIAYQTAWLKAHYPADFMAAVLSADMEDTDKIVRGIHECRQMGLSINPPDINLSGWRFTTHKGAVVYGMGAIKGLGSSVATEILSERSKGARYESLVDFLYRNPIRKTATEAGIHAGLFDFTGMDRAELLATYPLALAASKQLKKQNTQSMLFDFELPPAPRKNVKNMEVDIRLNGERKVLGLYLTGHPYARHLDAMRQSLTGTLSEVLANAEDESIPQSGKWQSVTVAGLITDVDIKSDTRGNLAYLKLDDSTARVSCAIYNKAYHEYQAFIKDDMMVVMKGWVHVNPKTNAISLRINVVEPLQIFMETQPGNLIITLDEHQTVMSTTKELDALFTGEEEGNISISVRESADGERVDLPLQGISFNSPAYHELVSHHKDRAKLQFTSAELRSAVRKQASDITPVKQVDDIEAVKSSLRRELEGYLREAAAVMSKSVEMTP